MKTSLFNMIRKQKKLVNTCIFLISWSQIHAQANHLFLNKEDRELQDKEYKSLTSKGSQPEIFAGQKPSSDSLEPSAEVSEQKEKVTAQPAVHPKSNPSVQAIALHNDYTNNSRYYISDIKQGVIGKDEDHPIDQVYDNIFTVNVDQAIKSNSAAWLEYELYGVTQSSGISKYINDELAIGGKAVEKNNQWTFHSEALSTSSIIQGKNKVTFTIPSEADYTYKVRNVRIRIDKSAPSSYQPEKTVSSALIKNIAAGAAGELNWEGAGLEVNKGILKTSQNFSVTPLRDIDIPATTPEFVNVTKQHFAYRFLPHGEHFSIPAKVTMAYDKSKIPSGYTEQDIRAFYFDDVQKKWIALEKDSLMAGKQILVSRTTHFTDMIAGIIKVPESPETGNYAPNSIKDIKAADPSTGIVSIGAPSPNSMGTVNTSFPIKLPAGRQGMQPSLSVNYSSEGSNGWMGLGWDLSIPAISIDSRWGVPKYDGAKESEIYSFGGEQLTFKDGDKFVLPNRAEGFDKNRVAERQFYPRIEGAYNKIIRHGSSPSNYWWEVISKDGTRNFFGGDGSAIVENAVLRQEGTNNIGHWALYKTVDTNGNYVEYKYNVDDRIYQGNPGNGGQEMYIKEINYTLHNTPNQLKNYKIVFETVSGRSDVQISGRLGFLQVTSKKLNKIKITYGGEPVRSYDFTYKEGAFYKTLLESITEKGTDENEDAFYTNRIEYNEAPQNLFGPEQSWSVTDNISFSGLASALQGGYSLLSGNYGSSIGGSFRVGVGVVNLTSTPPQDTSLFSFNKGTFGAHGGYSRGGSETKISLVDIDGDNLPDRVYIQDDGVYYSKNQSTATNGTQSFGAKVKIGSLSNLGKANTNTWNVGISANFVGIDTGFDYQNSTSITKSYFYDFNDDKLVDFVKDGKVYFNHIVNGVPTFDPDSEPTPYPINVLSTGAQTSTSLFDEQDRAEKKTMLEQNPLHDIVKVWVAPRTGSITVRNSFKLNQVNCDSNDDCSKADGVAVAFQYKDNTPLVQNIDAGDYNGYAFLDQNINISKGEKLYFRVSSKYDGALDQVTWNPLITYSNSATPAVDSDNRNLNVYTSNEDFVNTSVGSFTVPAEGTLNIVLNKPIALSDDAKVVVTINGTETSFLVSSASTYLGTALNAIPIVLQANDNISVKVYTDTQVDWTKFKLLPEFNDGNTGKKTYLQVQYSMYNDRGGMTMHTLLPADIGKKLALKMENFPPSFNKMNDRITISAKTKNKLLTKTNYTVIDNNNNISTTGGTFYTVTADDVTAGNNEVYLETTVNSGDGSDFAKNISSIDALLTIEDGATGSVMNFNNTPPHKSIFTAQNTTVALSSNQYDGRFGILYRGWGGFILNGNNTNKANVVEAYDLNSNYANSGTVAEMKVNETNLKLSDAYGTDQSNTTITDPTVDPNGNVVIGNNDASLSKNYFLMLSSNINNNDKGRLEDVDPAVYISQNAINASRLNIRNIDSNFSNQTLSQVPGSKLNAPEMKYKNQSVSGRVGGSAIGLSIGASKSLFNENKSIRSLIDFNGDGFPDDFAKTNVQISNALGFLSSNSKDVGSNFISKADFAGLSAGYSFKHGDAKFVGWGIMPAILAIIPMITSDEAKKSVSISGNLDIKNDQWAKQSFIDINGDGLPDKFNNGTFELNVGEKLVNNTSWGISEVSTSKEQSIGGGLGVSLFKGSFEGGVNLSTTTSTSQTELLDINGDGLSDYIVYTGSGVDIAINKGNGFSSATSISALESIVRSLSLGGNIGFTVPTPIVIPPSSAGIKLTFSGGVSAGESSSKTKSTFKDMNGDGYLDYVTSDGVNDVKVRLSQIGTTNLLKKVILPMGGSWEVSYERVGNTYNLPQSKWVMASVITNDGFTGDSQFKPDVSKITVTYENPYHSRRERTFYGFEKVRTNQINTGNGGAAATEVYRYTLQNFNNSSYFLKGALESEALYDVAGNKWTEKVNTLSLRAINNSTIALANVLTKEAEKGLTNFGYFTALDKTTSSFYEGQASAGKSTSTEMVYDNYGNLKQNKDLGDIQIGANELLTSEVTYQITDNASGYLILPTKVRSTATGVVRERTAQYDNKGNVTGITMVGPGNPVNSFEYDMYGNIKKATGPANYQGQRFFHEYTYDLNVATYPTMVKDAFGYSSKAEYDFRFGVPVFTEDMNLQPTQYAYDGFGRTTEITGPYEMFNDIPWTIQFDYQPVTFAPSNNAVVSYATTRHYDPDNANNTINTVSLSDGLGNPIQVKKSAEIYQKGLRYVVSGKVEQDAFGRALKTYYPTETTGAPYVYDATVDNIVPTISTYDVLDRVLTTKLPDEDLISEVEYGFGNDREGRQMFRTIMTDELGTIKKTYMDMKGRTTTVHEPSNTGDIFTSFTHDAIGELLKVRDVQNNLTTSIYDDLGRRTSMTHPDSGTSTFVYDPASNMTSRTNAENETATYEYDYKRLKAINYPKYPENNVKYYYGQAMDASAMDNNSVGRLWYQTDATGTQYLKYGRLGELTHQRRSIAAPGAGVYWFGTEWEYDTWNRVKTITYPDGEKVSYKYNLAGNLKSMASVKDGFARNIINDLGYDKFDQRVFLKYGNGTTTSYEYETKRRRLLKMNAQTPTNRYFMKNLYQYDVVSNVLQIHNNAPVAQAGLLGGGTNHAYGYDDLYRLTSANGNWRGLNPQGQEERQRYTVTMAYDNMHNVMSKTQKHERAMGNTGNVWNNMEATSYRLNYRYESTKPHAPTTIVDEPNVPGALCCDVNNPQVKFQNYTYDKKGNPTAIAQQTCNATEPKTKYLWDEENRMRFVDTNPSTPEVDGSAIYTYDAGGERIIKNVLSTAVITGSNGTSQTITKNDYNLYPNGMAVARLIFNTQTQKYELSYTKHYYAGSQRINSKLGKGKDVGLFNCAWLIIPFGTGASSINEKVVAKEKLEANTTASLAIMAASGITPPPKYGQNAGYTENCVPSYAGVEEKDTYWYHPDHLGSSSFITGLDGEVTQNIEYFPSGEVFVENHKNSYNTPYKFNGKEQDDETGYYYYGARYYNPRVSLWLNVDPLAEYNPFMNDQAYIDGEHNGGVYNSGNNNPYIYTYQNPIRYIDPNGKQVEWNEFWDGVNETLYKSDRRNTLDTGRWHSSGPKGSSKSYTDLAIERDEMMEMIDSTPSRESGKAFGDVVMMLGALITPGPADDAAAQANALSNAARKVSSKKLLKDAQLPTQGRVRFIPSASDLKNGKLTKKNNGYVDKFGNTWKKGPSRTKDEAFEWDVQLTPKTGKLFKDNLKLSRDGKHLNISLKGKVTHK